MRPPDKGAIPASRYLQLELVGTMSRTSRFDRWPWVEIQRDTTGS